MPVSKLGPGKNHVAVALGGPVGGRDAMCCAVICDAC